MEKPKLLVIENEPGILDILRINFTIEGFDVYGCDHSPESLKEALIELPDVIILDILMPFQNGWEVLEELKVNPVTQVIPIVVCSVLTKPEEQDRARSLGAAAYVTKPFDVVELVETVKRVIGLKG